MQRRKDIKRSKTDVRKIIFLDVDGVLNNKETFHNQGRKIYVWDIKFVQRLNHIVEKTGAEIVLSSFWRIFKESYDVVINEMKIDIIGETPIIFNKPRGYEIQLWLDDNPDVNEFVILDDIDEMVHLKPHLVQTSFDEGLTKEITIEVIKRLGCLEK